MLPGRPSAESPGGNVPLCQVGTARRRFRSLLACPAQAPPPGPAPRPARERARACGRGRVGKQRLQAPGGEARAPAPAPAPAPTRSARPSHDQGHPHLQQPRKAAALQVLSALCEYAPAADPGEGEGERRRTGQRPAASSARPSRRRGPPGARLLAPPPVSSGGGEPLPLPAGTSPAVGEEVSPPREALPTCLVPQPGCLSPGPSAPHRDRAAIFLSGRPARLPVPLPAAQPGQVDCFLSPADRWATVSALILFQLSNFGSPCALASLSRMFPYGSIRSRV